MTDNNPTEWDYCTIRSSVRYKGEDATRGGIRTVWLIFTATAEGKNYSYVAAKSAEFPMPGNIMGGMSYGPDKNVAGHVSIHNNLVRTLTDDGWRKLPSSGGSWWELRLRRPARLRLSWVQRLRRLFYG